MPLRFLAIACFMLALISLGAGGDAIAQQVATDTVGQNEDPKALLKADEFEQINLPDSASLPDPRKAAFLSAILPGMGQAYNGALWKVPLIYAGGITFVYAVSFYNQRYGESIKNYRLLSFEPTYVDPRGITADRYQRQAESLRRQRDYFIILGAGFYGLQIVEAYVDAQLQTFDLDEDLSMRIRPTLIPDPTGSMVAGIRITYTFP